MSIGDRIMDQSAEREDATQLVTIFVGGQMFGLSILQVRDVFLVNSVTPVPLAPAAVAGLYNLRGRRHDDAEHACHAWARHSGHVSSRDHRRRHRMARRILWASRRQGRRGRDRCPPPVENPIPTNLDRRWIKLSTGVHRLDTHLLVELNLEALIQDAIRESHPGVIPVAA